MLQMFQRLHPCLPLKIRYVNSTQLLVMASKALVQALFLSSLLQEADRYNQNSKSCPKKAVVKLQSCRGQVSNNK